jgi:hypothetical protein
VSKAKVHQRLWSVARDARKLAEEDQLDTEPANLECHLRRSQEDASKLGEVLDVYSRTLALAIAQTLLFSDNLDHLRLRQL